MNKKSKLEDPSAKVSHKVTVLNQPDSSQVIQRMLGACGKQKDAECLACFTLRRKLEALSSPTGPDQLPSIEMEQSRIVRQHFPLCAPPPDVTRGSLDSTASVTQQPASTETSIIKFGISGEQHPEAAGALKQTRESQLSDPGGKHGADSRALNYGLHHLIQEIEDEPNRNHRHVLKNIEQAQLHSLLAQITCKDTLFKENESNARLLRIEQELTDLMNREDVVRLTQDTRHGTGSVVGGVSAKKTNHEHGY